jgi:tryptophanase
MKGDESYAGARSFFRLQKAVQEVLGYKYVIPTHQGRAAENILFGTILKEGDIIPFNMPFDTTAQHVELNGGEVKECVSDIAYDPQAIDPSKGMLI